MSSPGITPGKSTGTQTGSAAPIRTSATTSDGQTIRVHPPTGY